MSQRMYLATVTMDVLVYVDDDPEELRLGGELVDHDEMAAFHASGVPSWRDSWQEKIDEGGYPLTIAQVGVTRLRRVRPDEDVETDPDVHRQRRKEEER